MTAFRLAPRPAVVLAASAMILGVSPAESGAAASVPKALVIGNGTYAALPTLPACTASAHVVSASLRRAGFTVTEAADLSNGEMGSDIAAFTTADPGTGKVLYICGYASDYQGRAFLLPASAAIQRDTDVLTQGMTASSVAGAMARSGTPAGLVLIDAVDVPNAAAPVRLDKLAAGATTGLAAAAGTTPPQGATRLAATFAAVLGHTGLEVGALLRAISAAFGTGDAKLTTAIPPTPLPLAAAPSPPPVMPPAAKPPPRPPSVAASDLPDEAHMTDADRGTIQSALLRLGYYDQHVDGLFGAETRAAIRRFQHEIGADMTGIITPAQTARLLGPAPAAPSNGVH